MLLAIDTATSQVSLALHDGHALITEQSWHSLNNHTAELAPAVSALIQRTGRGMDSITALAVALGPGSYSALRIGVAFAKGIASVRKIPLIGVTTLDILAAVQAHSTRDLYPVVQAGRSRVTAARYTWNESQSRWLMSSEPYNTGWEGLIAAIRDRGVPARITGEVDPEGAAQIKAAGEELITLAVGAERLRRAGYLAEEAWNRLRASGGSGAAERLAETFNAAALVPVYVKS